MDKFLFSFSPLHVRTSFLRQVIQKVTQTLDHWMMAYRELANFSHIDLVMVYYRTLHLAKRGYKYNYENFLFRPWNVLLGILGFHDTLISVALRQPALASLKDTFGELLRVLVFPLLTTYQPGRSCVVKVMLADEYSHGFYRPVSRHWGTYMTPICKLSRSITISV